MQISNHFCETNITRNGYEHVTPLWGGGLTAPEVEPSSSISGTLGNDVRDKTPSGSVNSLQAAMPSAVGDKVIGLPTSFFAGW